MRYGTYTPDGTLDYRVYCVESREFEIGPDGAKSVLEADLLGDAAVNDVCRLLYSAIPRQCINKLSEWYANVGRARAAADVIRADIGDDWTFFRYVAGGNWYSFAKRASLDDSDQLTYKDKARMFALYDNMRWYSPKEDLEDAWDFDEIRRHIGRPE